MLKQLSIGNNVMADKHYANFQIGWIIDKNKPLYYLYKDNPGLEAGYCSKNGIIMDHIPFSEKHDFYFDTKEEAEETLRRLQKTA